MKLTIHFHLVSIYTICGPSSLRPVVQAYQQLYTFMFHKESSMKKAVFSDAALCSLVSEVLAASVIRAMIS
jgi:hypothetical protein